MIAAAGVSGIANAQSRGGPAELPPAGFSGQQYIDSRGCVYLRAGHGGQVNWVQRVGSDRKPLCGYPPTTTTMARAKAELDRPVAAATPAPVQPSAPSGRRPMDTVASVTTPPRISAPAPRSTIPAATYAAPRMATARVAAAPAAAAPVPSAGRVMAQPSGAPGPTVFTSAPVAAQPSPVLRTSGAAQTAAQTYVPSPAPGPTVFNSATAEVPSAPRAASAPPAAAGYSPLLAAGTPGCPSDAPYGRQYDLVSGGRVMVCTATGRVMTGLRLGDDALIAATQTQRTSTMQLADATAPVVPRGYKPAWTDDRLNPHRAQGTAHGQQQMNRHWSVDVPQKVIIDAERAGKKVKRATQSSKSVAVSAKAMVAPVAVAAAPKMAGARFVQVGSFGVPDNAARAAQRLRAMGMPVQISRSSIKGKPVQVVRAGPFASSAEAASALSAARGAGFGDALLR
jgi:cell division septation protein DedD